MRHVLVTGSGRRLRTGYHIALACAKRGWVPLLHYRSSPKDAELTLLELKEKGCSTWAFQSDLTQYSEVQQLREQILEKGIQLDAIVHTLGNYDTNIHETNFESSKHISEVFYNSLKSSEVGGRLIYFGAAGLNGDELPEGNDEYFQTKVKLMHFMRLCARDWASEGIAVNMVSPGEMAYSILDREDLPMGRTIQPDELSRVVLFLLEEDSSSITGQNIEVAGALNL